ncbi:MAG: protein-L-isoaspartate(D-aspartate) O-methyltransferase [Dichotomicrobium sp.]
MTDALTRMELVLQLRRRGITDVRVLNAFEHVPREMFVPADFADSAYGDTALPIACGQTISQPFVVAYMTEKLGPDPAKAVLEIGTGSGYQTAILAHLFREVFTLEYHEPLTKAAEARFKALGLDNITAAVGDGWQGWPDGGECERIIVTAAAPEIPPALLRQLAAAGRMIIPLEYDDGQYLTEVTRDGGEPRLKRLLPVKFVPLVRIGPAAT